MSKIATPDGKRKVLAPVRPNVGLQAEYQRRLDTLIAEMHRSVLFWLRAAYRRNPPELAADASPASDLEAEMQDLGWQWQSRFDDMAPELGRWFAASAATRSDATMRAILGRAGWTVRFRPTRAWNDVRQATIKANVELIKSIPSQCLTQVQGAVMRSVQTGRDLGSLTKELQEQFGVTFRRAALISRSQNEMATSAITRMRQQELGITTAVWQHSSAGREPRPSHLANNGKTYEIAKGWFDPEVKEFIWPGQLLNCRCSSRPVIEGLS